MRKFGVLGVLLLVSACASTPEAAPQPQAQPQETSPEQAQPAPEVQPSPPPQAEPANARRPGNEWQTNEAGLDIIKAAEGLRLTAYQEGDHWLVGYGHARGVKAGMTITEAEADAFLKDDVIMCQAVVADSVKVPVTQNEFSAMVSLCYNIGPHTFSGSSVVRLLNAGDRAGAGDAFLLWNKGRVNGVKQEIPYLTQRRRKERALFLA